MPKSCVLRNMRVTVVQIPTCQTRASFSFLRANEPMRAKGVPIIQFGVPTCQRCANVSTWPFNVPNSVPIFQTFLLQNAERNFYTLLLYKKFYIILDMICICIVHKNCIILHFYTSCDIKEKCAEFLFLDIFLFFS